MNNGLQISWEINIAAILYGQVIAQNLERDDVQQPLQAVNRLWHTDRLGIRWDTLVAFVAQYDGLSLASSNLGQSGLDLGVERILGHDDDNRHVLIDQGKRTMLQLSSEDTCQWRLTRGKR